MQLVLCCDMSFCIIKEMKGEKDSFDVFIFLYNLFLSLFCSYILF
jgi:hypothetical protein